MVEMQPLEATEKITEEIIAEITAEITEVLDDEGEVRQPVPFGESGAAFLRNVTQHAVFLGFVMLILMFIRVFGQQ